MGSKRLPGKVLKKLSNDNTILDVLIKRLKLSKFVDEIIICTTRRKENKGIIKIAKNNNVPYFIGSENNVLKRYYKCAKQFNLDTIIRITSDCPFVDPFMLDEMLQFYRENCYDFIYNVVEELTNIPIGFDIEIFSFLIIEKVFRLARSKKDKEHVTSFINFHPDLFSIHYYNISGLKKIEGLRLTIDEPEDLEMCRKLYKKLVEKNKPIDFSIYDILEAVEENPEIVNINKHIKNKQLLFD